MTHVVGLGVEDWVDKTTVEICVWLHEFTDNKDFVDEDDEMLVLSIVAVDEEAGSAEETTEVSDLVRETILEVGLDVKVMIVVE